MCLLIAENREDEFILWFNRDDSVDRLSSNFCEKDTLFYPLDKKSWWTWIWNDTKWRIIALLNNDGDFSENRETRGNIIVSILEWENDVDSLDFKKCNPFQLFYFSSWDAKILYWDWVKFKEESLSWNFRKVMTSSSYWEQYRNKRRQLAGSLIEGFSKLTPEILKSLLSNDYKWFNEISETTMSMMGKHSKTLSTSIVSFSGTTMEINHSYKNLIDDIFTNHSMHVLPNNL